MSKNQTKRYWLDSEYVLKPSPWGDLDVICFCIAIVNEEETIVFDTTEDPKDFFEWIGRQTEPVEVYAHNGGKADFVVIEKLLNQFPEYDTFERTVMPQGSSLFKYKLGKVTFYDTINLFRGSLENLARDLLGKEKMKIDYTNIENIAFNDFDYLCKACVNHAQLLMEVHKYFLNELNLNFSVKTAGQASHKLMEKYGLDKSCKLDEDTNNFYEEWYFGGRTEIFKMKNKPGEKIFYYDINSAYPYAMTKVPLYKNIEKIKIKNLKEIEKYKNNLVGVYAKVKINRKIPVIPVTNEIKKGEIKLIFPNGIFETFIWKYEFELLKPEEIVEIKWISVGHDPIYFDNFVNDYYKKRFENPSNKAIYKIVLNSAYGKFGQKSTRVGYSTKRTKKSVEYAKINNREIYRYEYFNEYKYHNVVYAAMITSFVRAHLYKLMEEIGLDSVYYCDTDSIFSSTPPEKINYLLDEKELGKLKIEKSNIIEYEAVQPKVYKLKTDKDVIVKAKGYNYNGELKSNEEKENLFTRIVQGREIPVKYFPAWKGIVKNLKAVTQKCLSSEYNKRKVVDEYDTIPWVINEETTNEAAVC